MKYIIVDSHITMAPVALIWGEECSLTHEQLFNALCNDKSQLLGAGMCGRSRETGGWIVWGRSISLDMESKPQDAKFIDKQNGRRE